MFKAVFKTYFHNLKYTFTALGLMFIGAILLLTDLAEMVGDAANIIGSVGTLFGEGTDAAMERLAEAGVSLVVHFAGGLICQLLSIVAAFIVVSLVARKHIQQRSIFHTLLSVLTDALVLIAGAAILILITVTVTQAAPKVGSVLGIVFLVFFLLLYGFLMLLGAYLSEARGRLALKQAVSVKAVLGLYAANLLICLVTGALGLGIALVFRNILLVFYFEVTMLMLLLVTVSVSANAYVKRQLERFAPEVAAVQPVCPEEDEALPVPPEILPFEDPGPDLAGSAPQPFDDFEVSQNINQEAEP